MPRRSRTRSKRGLSENALSTNKPFRMESIARPMRSDPIYTVTKRVVAYGLANSSASVETFTANGITLNGFNGYSSLVAAFDQYRFETCEFEFLPRLTVNDGVVANAGVFVSVVDYDDITNLTSTNQALSYPNAQLWTGDPGKRNLLRHRFVPRIAMAAYQGAFSGYANLAQQWCDTGTPGIAHYGVKSAWSVTSTALTMDMVVTATISFRGSRS